MKARTIIIAAAFAVLAILSAGCKKHSFWTPTPGETIRFRAQSKTDSYDAGTKAVYSGQYYSVEGYANKFERIDWEEGDMISIGYVSFGGPDGLCADKDHYRLSDITSDGKSSFANTIEPTGGPRNGNGLRWRNNTHHRFFATYPSVDFDDDDFDFEIVNNDLDIHVPYNYPATQVPIGTETKNIVFCGSEATATLYKPDMSYAYLFCNPYDYYRFHGGVNKEYLSTGETINLPFEPHFTAFEVTFAAKEGQSFPINSASVISMNPERPLAGTFIFQRYMKTVVIDEEEKEQEAWKDVPKEGTTSNKATINFSNVTLDDEHPVVITFIISSWEDMDKVALSFNINKNGQNVNRSIRLTGGSTNFDAESGWLRFGSTLKYRINNLRVPLEANAVWFEGVSAGEFENVDLDF